LTSGMNLLSAPKSRLEIAARWIAFAYMAWIYCPLRVCAPARTNADNTWLFALNFAAAHHLKFGTDFVWTWGPLAYLLVPFHIGNNLLYGLIFQSILWILLGFAFWDVSVHSDFEVRNVQLFAVFMALSVVNLSQELYPWNPILLIALLFLVHFQLRGGTPRLFLALFLMGLMPLFQFAGAVSAAGVIIGFVAHRLLNRCPGALRQAALAIAIPLTVAVIGGWATLGTFGTAQAYLRSSLELARGYALAMTLLGTSTQLYYTIATLVLFAAVLAFLFLLRRETAQFFALILTVPALFEFRHSIVRQDGPHLVQFFSFCPFAFALIALAVPLRRRLVEAAALATLCFLCLLSSKADAITDYPGAARAMMGARVPGLLTKTFHYRSLVAWLDESAIQNAAAFGLPPEMKALVGRSSIAYVSHLFSNALGEDMNLELLPVPQNFSAFTPYLDGRNAEWISSHGPQYLVFEFAAIDDRHPLTEAPATWAAIYRWYETMATGRQYILLERRKEPRFERFETLQSRSIQFGEAVSVPASEDPIFWTLRCSPSREGKLRVLFFRVPEVTMTITLQNGHKLQFRALLAVTGTPSIGNHLPTNLSQVAAIFGRHLALDFSDQTIQFGGPGSTSYEKNCALEFLRTVN
jgi:hypothetical protein